MNCMIMLLERVQYRRAKQSAGSVATVHVAAELRLTDLLCGWLPRRMSRPSLQRCAQPIARANALTLSFARLASLFAYFHCFSYFCDNCNVFHPLNVTDKPLQQNSYVPFSMDSSSY
jgi:hypothetical protein